jgi:3-hydroxy-9,10-secoandrosta-1,3,5(10)-triene-9,17-dione monooxygenase reductase component
VTSTSVPARPNVQEPGGTGQTFREVMGRYTTGVAIVTASWQGKPHGLAVNSLTSVSLDPPLVLFCPDKNSDTWPAIRDAGSFGVNILSSGQAQMCRQFSRKGADRFADVSYTRSSRGCPVLAETLAYLECEIEQVIEAGDHYVTIGRVVEMGMDPDLHPLAFHQGRFHRLADIAAGAATAKQHATGEKSEGKVQENSNSNGSASPETAVTAEKIKAVRKETRAGGLDCRKALEATDGDVRKAVEYLHEKGMGSPRKVWT